MHVQCHDIGNVQLYMIHVSIAHDIVYIIIIDMYGTFLESKAPAGRFIMYITGYIGNQRARVRGRG